MNKERQRQSTYLFDFCATLALCLCVQAALTMAGAQWLGHHFGVQDAAGCLMDCGAASLALLR